MRLASKAVLVTLWLAACLIGFPLVIVLVWLLSPDQAFSGPGIVILGIAAALLVYSMVKLANFLARP